MTATDTTPVAVDAEEFDDLPPWTYPEAAEPTTAGAGQGLIRYGVDHASRVEVEISRYPDRDPIRVLTIVDPSGIYVSLTLGYTIQHEIVLADRLIAALTDLRDGASYDLAHPSEALKPETDR